MVFWNLNHFCDYRCEYCFCGKEKLSAEHPDVGKHSAERIFEAFTRTGKTWQIHMSGGEPFLYPGFVELCQKLTEKHCISINTNFSTSNVFNFADTVKREKVFFINAGLHIAEREKNKSALDEFIRRVLYFQDKGFNIDVGYLTYPPLLERMAKDIGHLRDKGVKLLNAKVFRGFYAGRRYPGAYTDTEREIIKKYTLDVREIDIIDKKMNFFGSLCGTGMKYFRMDPAGNLFRCSSSFKSYGNLFDGTYSPDTVYAPCPVLNCDCPYEGLRYAKNEKGSYGSVCREALAELAAIPRRGITIKKILRHIRKRLTLNSENSEL
ncbi:MAG: radical SAM protein [Candidatus Omnitrophica bacterium]|nr:radical SAM protein [Candidatus Omnitrophota bacterium]